MRSYTISKRDTRTILSRLAEKWPTPIDLGKVKSIRVVEVDEMSMLLLSESFEAVKIGDEVLPFLRAETVLNAFPRVVVDSGAVKFVCKGADVMRPGIVSFQGEFSVDSIVVVQEGEYQKYIAVGLATVGHPTVVSMDKGAVVKNLHYIGDRLWEAYKQVKV